MSNPNIVKKIFGNDWGDFSAWAWRREPDQPEWHVYVKYGDGGHDVDPGVYGESLDTAIADVAQALDRLTALYGALEEFKWATEGVTVDDIAETRRREALSQNT